MAVAGLRPTNTTINAIDLTSELASSAATAYNGNLSQNRWAIKGFVSDTATIADLLRDGKVECSSCHDPHFNNLRWDEVESTWADGIRTSLCGDVGEDCSAGNFLRRSGKYRLRCLPDLPPEITPHHPLPESLPRVVGHFEFRSFKISSISQSLSLTPAAIAGVTLKD